MRQLHLLLLGPPEVRLGAGPLTFPTRKTLALLAYLALEPGPQPRERLAALFWPDVSAARSYGSLRNTLSHLQTALRRDSGQDQPNYLLITHEALALDPEADLQIDLHTIEQAYALARADRSSRAAPDGTASLPLLQAAVTLHRGDFLAGFSLGDAPAFDEWVGIQREAWRRRLGLILDRLSELQFGRGDFAGTAETASQWLALDGLNEVAYRRKMRAHFAAGERGQALQTYETCRALLASELNITPEPDTESLVARIRSQHLPQPPEAKHAPPDTPASYLEGLFAGRSAELQLLLRCSAMAAEGQPQVAVLSGEAGIGKTRLAHAFLESAIAQGAGVLRGGAYESGRGIPFQPWVEALRTELERDDLPPDWRRAPWLSALAGLIPGLPERYAGLVLRPEETGLVVDAPSGQARLFEALAQFTLARAERAPLVLFFDDLQWADNATLDALHYILRRWRATSARAMVLVNLRREGLPISEPLEQRGLIAWLHEVDHNWQPCHVDLEFLDGLETVQMMQGLLDPSATDFADWVFSETRGQPFYIMETLKDLLERGALHPHRRPNGKWVFEVDRRHDLGQAVRVPSTVRAVIRSRLSRLSPAAYALLAAGTVLEHALTFERLCIVANLTPDVGLPALDELLSGRLLRDVAKPGRANVFAFANDMLRDVAYTEAGDARRRLFHQRALGLLEAEHDPAAVLAHHALAAGAAQDALRHSLAAVEDALRIGAPVEARTHLASARRLAGEAALAGAEIDVRLRELYAQLSLAHEHSGQPELAAEALAERARVGSGRRPHA